MQCSLDNPGSHLLIGKGEPTFLDKLMSKVGAELLSRFDLLGGVMLELMSRTSTSSAVASFEVDIK